jgi:hypothetical protein
MRKRSFDLGWAYVGIFAVAIAFTSLLTVIELLTMHHRKPLFFNVRTANLEDLRRTPEKSEAFVTENTPVFYFAAKSVVFGRVKSVIAPGPGKDVLLVPRGEKLSLKKKTVQGPDWKKHLEDQFKTWQQGAQLFPTRVIAIAFESTSEDMTEVMEIFRKTVALSAVQNKRHAKGDAALKENPVPILLRFPLNK